MTSNTASWQESRAHCRMERLRLHVSAVASDKAIGAFNKHWGNKFRVNDLFNMAMRAFNKHWSNKFHVNELFDVKGKVALVTGGSKGIGRVIAEGLAANGCKVYITSGELDECVATAKELSDRTGAEVIPFASVRPGSFISPTGGFWLFGDAILDFMSAREERLHILVNNAGATWGGMFDEYPLEERRRLITLNIYGALSLIRKLAMLLEAAGRPGDPARVINIVSVAAMMPQSNDSRLAVREYADSKAAAVELSVGLLKQLHADWGDRHISTNVICPGLFRDARIVRKHPIWNGMEQIHPFGRNCEPHDMAGTVLFLCSRAGSYVNGAMIPVDGGIVEHNEHPEEWHWCEWRDGGRIE